MREVVGIGRHDPMLAGACAQHYGGVDDVRRAANAAELPGGACTLVCQPGLTPCGGQCVNPMVDSANCGACNQPCAPGLVCNAGQCAATCQAPTASCGGNACIDFDHDPDNCGGCGQMCSPVANADRVCLPGMVCARSRCYPGTGDCNGWYPDGCEAVFSADPMNCGGCGIVCGGTQSCVSGSCL